MMSQAIREKITNIRQKLPAKVRLVAVSKYVSVEEIRAAYDAGIRDFGENKIQDMEVKKAQLQDLSDITWHLIGHLQTNKAKKALELFDWIHSVDSLNLAQKLNRFAGELSRQPQILLQVKILPDPQKFGWEIPQLMQDLPALNDCTNLNIRGLMVIAPLGLNELETLDFFQQARQLSAAIAQQNWSHISMADLSMGMSGDYPLAVQAGATIVRLGQILFR
jgi:pyridoxal phosphate enzyme (YggS family)